MSLGYTLRVVVAVVAISALSGLAATVDAWAAGPTVGMVTKVENQAQVGGVAAAVGTPVHMSDTLHTGAKARLQVTFRDQTNLTLGENATIVVDRFVFDPDASVGEAALNATKGAFRLTTGRISEMRNKNIGVTTSFGALAVRGTDFWWGPIEGQFGVLLVHNSRLDVRGAECPENDRRCRCAVTLDQAGEGTDFDRDRRCPGTPYPWPQARIDAALQMTGFQVAFVPSQAIPAGVGLAAAGAGFTVSTTTNNEGPPPFTPVVPVSP